MKYLIFLFIILLIIILNFGVLSPLGLSWIAPSLILLLIVSLSMEHNFNFVFFALLGGIWLDLYYALPIGSFLGAYVLLGFLGYSIFRHWLADTDWKYYLAVVGAAEILLLLWLWAYTNLMVRWDLGQVALSGSQLLRYSPMLLLGALLSAFPVYFLVQASGRAAKRWFRQPMQLS